MKPLKSGDPGRIGGIVLRGRLGEGGMGTVYFGLTPDGDRVAVKTIRQDLTANEEAKDRFDREILAVGMVAGPRIAALLAASEPDEEPPWFATEYVQGLTLSQYIQERGPLTTTMAAALGIMLAEGLNDIHTAGLLHRDLKPGNVILGTDGPRVIDFGLAGLKDSTGDITHTSGMLGTPVCMAPEQVAVTDPATDPDLTGLPEEIKQLVTGMLAHHPESRRTLADVSDELKHILNYVGLSPAQAQREFAQLTYMERDSDPPPAALAPRRDRRRLPGNLHVPSGLVRQVAEILRREYARGATL